MITFQLNIKSANQALTDYPQGELVRILRYVAHTVESGVTKNVCLDINGNRVGDWQLTIETEG